MTVIPESYIGADKREKVVAMFDSIASRYDLLNHVLSGGIDKRWRKKLINILAAQNPIPQIAFARPLRAVAP